MSIFTIELNPDFKIFNDKIFYQKNEFIKKCKLNNINYDNDIKLIKNSSIIDNSSLNTVEAVIEIINSSIYTDNNKNILFPEWKIFQVGYENNKNILLHGYNGLFEKYIQLFCYIAEVRYKDYLI